MPKDHISNARSKTTSLHFDYGAIGLSDEQITSLESCKATIASLGRRTTEQSFERGRELAFAFDLVPQRAYGKWVKASCGFTDRTARNYVSVHKRLETYRDKLTEIGAAPTILFELTKADPEQIEQALQLAHENGRLQVRDVKLILQGDKAKAAPVTADPYAVGGIAGLKNLSRVKIQTDLQVVQSNLLLIINSIQKALKEHRKGKRLTKSALYGSLSKQALHTYIALCNIVLPLASAATTPANLYQNFEFPKSSGWETVRVALVRLSVERGWPSAAALASWFEQDVLPPLQWAMAKNDPGALEPKPVPATPIEAAPAKTRPAKPRSQRRVTTSPFGEQTKLFEKLLNVRIV